MYCIVMYVLYVHCKPKTEVHKRFFLMSILFYYVNGRSFIWFGEKSVLVSALRIAYPHVGIV